MLGPVAYYATTHLFARRAEVVGFRVITRPEPYIGTEMNAVGLKDIQILTADYEHIKRDLRSGF